MISEARILVADDESAQRRLLRAYLSKAGYSVVEADNGLDALALLRGGGIDVALVDVMMPELDGFEVVRRIRAESTVPIILLSARGEETSRVAGLELGADDYVVKPFSAPEVVARVRTHLRRLQGGPATESTLHAGKVELDLEARRCTVGGSQIDLPRRQFDLLATLMRAPGRVFTRQQLLEHAWGTPYLSAKTVDVHVARLRAELGDAVQIVALRGVGYRLEG
ncbi:MAG TPA: response regulator transcription factor [Gaiellaceae bacterium]|nr:response regulator transcription factor [Gaiellaceae bacterium]